MKFRTEYKSASPPPFMIEALQPVLLLGSCFSDNIGARMQQCTWNACVNPTGTLYNPASIANVISMALQGRDPRVEYNEAASLWFSPDFSTLFSSPSNEIAVKKMHESIIQLKECVGMAHAIIITFGTAWIFERNNQIVANCHKLPASQFKRRRMDVAEIVTIWEAMLERIRAVNNDVKVIFTVSPVRHLADGFDGNARSKATLLLACEFLAQLPGCDYFPAYEIINDDLRDYRFYAADLLHPSPVAADYIFHHFCERYLSDSGRLDVKRGEKEYKRSHHRPLI